MFLERPEMWKKTKNFFAITIYNLKLDHRGIKSFGMVETFPAITHS